MDLDSLSKLLPIPDILSAKRVLCIQPHPDDADIAFGGTMARLAQAGCQITLLTVTDGSAGSAVRTNENELAVTRRREQTRAGEQLGVESFLWLDYRDDSYLSLEKLQADFIRTIRQVRPDFVMTVDPWLPYEAHPAHRNVGLATSAAVLFSGMGNVHPDEAVQPHNVQALAFGFTARPNTYLDVSTTWERKLAAIQCHQSQFPAETWPFFEQYFTAKAMQYGEKANCTYAEALKILTPTHLHCNVDAEWL